MRQSPTPPQATTGILTKSEMTASVEWGNLQVAEYIGLRKLRDLLQIDALASTLGPPTDETILFSFLAWIIAKGNLVGRLEPMVKRFFESFWIRDKSGNVIT